MPNPLIGVAAIGGGSSLLGARAQSKAAKSASAAQQESAQMGIEEQRRQFDAVRELLSPFVEVGTEATGALSELAGLSGDLEQRRAIRGIEGSPEFQSLLQQGEEGILANASATGGLRGGNTQEALMQFRPSLLSQQIGQRYQRLGGIAGMGQSAAAGQASAAQNLGANVSGLMQQQGAAAAGGALARGQASANMFGGIGKSLGGLFGAGIPEDGIPKDEGIFTSWGGF